MKQTIEERIEKILNSGYDKGNNRKCIFCRFESTSYRNSLSMHMNKAHNAPTKIKQLLALIVEERGEQLKQVRGIMFNISNFGSKCETIYGMEKDKWKALITNQKEI